MYVHSMCGPNKKEFTLIAFKCEVATDGLSNLYPWESSQAFLKPTILIEICMLPSHPQSWRFSSHALPLSTCEVRNRPGRREHVPFGVRLEVWLENKRETHLLLENGSTHMPQK